ncbi:hypothetical protein [Halobaculum sp. MBLA0143]|uniref:hypothetical protein n=1 Tax=Halobaculum sp. MBLA0143 TaxID=3079933 RepID=UPI00352449B2
MTDPTDPFAAVDTARVAADHGVAEPTLADALAAVRDAAAAPTVPALVYDYRQAFQTDPLVARHGDTHYLAVPERVWPEFAATLSLSDATLAACRAAHAAAFRVVEEPPDDHEPLVLV